MKILFSSKLNHHKILSFTFPISILFEFGYHLSLLCLLPFPYFLIKIRISFPIFHFQRMSGVSVDCNIGFATKYQFDFIDFQVFPQNIIYCYPVLRVQLYLLMFVFMYDHFSAKQNINSLMTTFLAFTYVSNCIAVITHMLLLK